MSIINRLLSLLEKKGLKQADLCEAIGISSSTMTNWKNRGTDPPAKYIIPICEFLNITPYLLLTNKESSPKNKLSNDEQELIEIYSNLSPESKVRIRERAIVLAELETSIPNKLATEEEPTKKETNVIESSALTVSAGAGKSLICDSSLDLVEIKRNELAKIYDFFLTINADIMMMSLFKDSDVILARSQPDVHVIKLGVVITDENDYEKKHEQEMLEIFKSFNEREQVKIIGRMEEWLEVKRQREVIAQKQRIVGVQVARRTDGKFVQKPLTVEEFERIEALPEDTDY